MMNEKIKLQAEQLYPPEEKASEYVAFLRGARMVVEQLNIPENMKEITDLASHLVKEESSAVNSILPQDNLFVTKGWQCPICKRVYSPFVHMCKYCGNKEVETIILPKLPKTVGLAQEQNSDFRNQTTIF